MKPKDFYRMVNEHEDLCGISVTDNGCYVRHKPTDTTTFIGLTAILDTEPEDIIGVLTLEREPQILHHLSRVVGYYSRVQNWNDSKIAELRARHKGNYGVEEPTHDGV